jgi:serine O-acetyltransferase
LVFKRIREDIDSILERDPAARSRLEVVLCYAGFHALLAHRLNARLWRAGWHTLAAFIANLARAFTGIEIHPGATIGRRLFIDHGTGVVIGETAELGDDVTLYQGVTLGGTSLEPGKRHPTLERGVIVGAGAKILGPITVGANARVGSNAVVLKAVPEGVTVVGIPAKPVTPKQQPPKFVAYGTPCEDLPDPVARALKSLADEVALLRRRLEALEGPAVNGHEAAVPEVLGDPVSGVETGNGAGATA